MTQRSTPEVQPWWRWAAIAVWALLSLRWLGSDKLLRDGDEEGHVGAAELCLSDRAQSDPAGFLERLFVGPMGEYPQFFAAVVGAWWWAMGIGNPAEVAVRAVCLLSLPVAAIATGRIAARLAPDGRGSAECWATVLVLTIPLANGLTRHFMPEGALIAVTAVAVLCALRWADHPSVSRTIQLGIVLGIGVLTKQTFVLAAAAPIVWIVRSRIQTDPLRVLSMVGVALAVAGPWWLTNGVQQWNYASASMTGQGAGSIFSHLWFYPRSLVLLGLGPVLALAAAMALWRGRHSRGWMLAMVWLAGGLLVLMVIPKKYPRLMAPILPAAVVLVVAYWRTRPRVMGAIALASLGWTALISVVELPVHSRSPGVDPGCPQQWIRPPAPTDLGLTAAATALAEAPSGDVLVTDDPAIPCALQTTHDWSTHLSPLLRRSGLERAVHTDSTRMHRFVLEWSEEGGQHEVPGLQKSFTIRDRLQP